MKKIIYILVTTFVIFFPFTVFASSRVVFTEKENGVIDTKLHFNDGFVGGFDILMSISDNVNVTNVQFNPNFKDFTTDYDFDKSKHLLTIKVTTGGVNQKHNLLNNKKELDLGNIYFSTDSKTTVNYLIVINKITVIDNSWKSVTYENNAINVDGTNIFSLIVNKNEEPSNDKKEETTKPESPKEDNTNNNNSTNDESENKNDDKIDNNQSNQTDNNSGNKPTDNSISSNKDDNTLDNNLNDDHTTSDNDNENNANDQNLENNNSQSNTKEKNNNIENFLKIVLCLISLVIVIIFVVIIRKKKIKK